MSKGAKSFLTAIKEANERAATGATAQVPVENTAAAPVESKEQNTGTSYADKLAARLAELQNNRAPLTQAANHTQPRQASPVHGLPLEETLSALPEGGLVLTPEEQALDSEIAEMNIISAYNRWADKGHIPPTNQVESIKIRCPDPQHPDNRPSAWINQDKGTWFCPGCGTGGDLWDIAAWHFGYPVPGYKTDKQAFRRLREEIAGDLGYKKYTTSAGTILSRVPPVVEQEEIPEDSPRVEAPNVHVAEQQPVPSNVVQLHAVADPEYAEAVGPTVPSIDWRQLVSPNSFLEAWMNETTKDTCPEEYHFWTGLMALGFAVGRHRVLLDNPKVSGNLFVCLTGPSGTGKSRARHHLKAVLAEALPFKQSDPMPMGTRLAGTPGSGEVLIDMFGHKIEDPSVDKSQWKDWPVRAYIEFDEMSALISKGARVGSSLKPTLMEVYDAPSQVSITSRTFGTSIAHLPFGQVMTTTQNRSIREVVNTKDDASGFVNRWMFVTGPRKKQRAINLHVTDYTAPSQLLKSIHSWALKPKDVSFTDTALELFEKFFEKVFNMKDRAELESAIFNRIDLLLKKLVLLFAVNDKSDLIQDIHVERVKALYPYLLQAYGVVQIELDHGSDEDREAEQKIYGAVQRYYDRKTESLSIGAVARYVKGVNSKDLVRIIENMIKLGYLIEEETPAGKRGRPSRKLLPGVGLSGGVAA